MRDGDARVGGGGDGAGHARHHHERHAARAQVLGLLAAAPKDERVPALEPRHGFARERPLGEQRVDLGLGQGMPLRLLAHVHALAGGRSVCEQRGVNEPVIDHHVGARERVPPRQRQQARVARPGPDEVDDHDRTTTIRGRRSPGRFSFTRTVSWRSDSSGSGWSVV